MASAENRWYTSRIVFRQTRFFLSSPCGTSGSPGTRSSGSPASRQWWIPGGSGTGSDTTASWKCVCQSCKGLNRNSEKSVCGKLAQLLSGSGLSDKYARPWLSSASSAYKGQVHMLCLISTSYLDDLLSLYWSPGDINCYVGLLWWW